MHREKASEEDLDKEAESVADHEIAQSELLNETVQLLERCNLVLSAQTIQDEFDSWQENANHTSTQFEKSANDILDKIETFTHRSSAYEDDDHVTIIRKQMKEHTNALRKA